jgi:uncharacterized circularly permuted ATP-grasp superfamily protein/uncharacterized alpha-E superfamily protein
LALTQPQPDPADEAALLALLYAAPPRSGHYDELRDGRLGEGRVHGDLRDHWRQFFAQLGRGGFADLDRRAATVGRQIEEDGISYNIHDHGGGPQRPWSLDLLPYILTSAEWQHLSAGIGQRAALLSAMMRDTYGAQALLHEALLPPALVYGNPGYLRPLTDVLPPGGTYLHIVAFDLARGPDGQWWVVGTRTQAPSGLGYALQNRLIVSRLFPDAFREMHVQRLASSYRRLLDTLHRLAPRSAGGADAAPPRVVLLTPGPYNETYFEHAYLARYLGIPLVEGNDLTVRDDQVFLKTLHGLERVHAILRRLDDDFCDPLELRGDSTLGVPGLLQAVRAGQVLVANALGSGFLESPAINGFLPAISRRLLNAELLLPSLPTWWCGERAAFNAVAGRLGSKVVKPTFPVAGGHSAFEPVMGADLAAERRAELLARIERNPDAYTVQDYLPLSQAPTWNTGALLPRAAMLRVYAIADGAGGWHALPGGLTRIAGRNDRIVAMQRGGSSMDTWVLTDGTVDTFSMLPAPLRPEQLMGQRRPVTSRSAENLFWMGRYTERADQSARLARHALTLLADDGSVDSPVLVALADLCTKQGLVPPETPSPAQSEHVFERTLIAGLSDTEDAHSVAHDLAAIERTAAQIRDRLAADHWRLVVGAGERFARDCARAQRRGAFSIDQANAALTHLAVRLTAITGAQTDRMTRDDGWRLLAIGRQIERLVTMATTLEVMFRRGAVHREDGFDLLLGLFDSTITYRALYQRRLEVAPLLDLLVLDDANPRALGCVARRMRRELERLPGAADPQWIAGVLALESWPDLASLCAPGPRHQYPALRSLVRALVDGGHALSDRIGTRFFSHAVDSYRTLRA